MRHEKGVRTYLGRSIQRNGRWLGIAWVCVLVFGLTLAIGRTTPWFEGVFSAHLLREFVVDIPLKLAFLVCPIVLFYQHKRYDVWQSENADVHLTKAQFVMGSYLEIVLAVLFGLCGLAVVWLVAGWIDPTVVADILQVGVFSLGEGFLWVSVMTTMVYPLMFTSLVRIAKGEMLVAICLLFALQVVIMFQPWAWYLMNDVGVGVLVMLLGYMLGGLVVLVIGGVLTARLYQQRH